MGDEKQQPPKPGPGPVDPWQIVAYLLSGMLFWGGAGWLLDHWLHTRFFVLIGMLIGTSAALYLTFLRLGVRRSR